MRCSFHEFKTEIIIILKSFIPLSLPFLITTLSDQFLRRFPPFLLQKIIPLFQWKILHLDRKKSKITHHIGKAKKEGEWRGIKNGSFRREKKFTFWTQPTAQLLINWSYREKLSVHDCTFFSLFTVERLIPCQIFFSSLHLTLDHDFYKIKPRWTKKERNSCH